MVLRMETLRLVRRLASPEHAFGAAARLPLPGRDAQSRTELGIVLLLLQDALANEGGREVEVDIAATTRESLRITVRDAGGGLAPEALPPRVRTLAEALGGRVAARSTLTEGTAVTVEIPTVRPGELPGPGGEGDKSPL